MFVRAACFLTTAICAGGLFASAAYAADIKPAVIYDLGGKFDKSFNEGVFNGATKFTKDIGVDFRDLEIQNDAQREQVLRKFAKDGFTPIMMPRLRLGDGARQDRRRIPQDQVRHHRHGGRQAQRAVDRVQGGGRLVPGRRDRRQDLEDRQGRLRRRHGHSADLDVRLRLRARRQIRLQRQGRRVRQHDRHDAGRLERSGQGRRTRQVADRPRRRHRLRRRRRDRPGRAEGRRRRRQARHRRRLRTRTTCSPAKC